MEEYKSNSHKSRERQKENEKKKEITKAISGTAKTKKKGELQKFTDIFVSEDASNVKSYILLDVLVPAAKKAISDIVTNGIDMILYGETRHSKSSGASKVSYRSYYDKANDRSRDRSVNRRNAYDYDDVILDTYGEADEVLDRMCELIETYGDVSVADLYELVGITDNNYMNHKYGWTDLRSAKPVRVRDGYILKLPRAMPI